MNSNLNKRNSDENMKIKILGTAAATSMPLVFCNCEVCKNSRLKKGKNFRKRAHAIINNEMLIDLSPDLCNSANMYDVDISKIKYLIQTHSHADHFDAGHFVTRWSEYATKNLNHLEIFCSKGTATDMNHWIKEQEPSMNLFDKVWMEDMNYSFSFMKHGDIIKKDNYKITAINSMHDERIEALIYIIEYQDKKVLYGTDLLEISSKSWKMLKENKLDLVILDQTYGAGYNNGGHLDAGQIVEIIDKMKKENIIDNSSLIYTTHFSHEGNNTHEIMEEEAQKYGYHIAYDGLEINL